MQEWEGWEGRRSRWSMMYKEGGVCSSRERRGLMRRIIVSRTQSENSDERAFT
jgi:hypothetical protein